MFFFFFQSGAKINISDGSCPERIVTVTGNTSAIFKAFTLICKKFEEVCIYGDNYFILSSIVVEASRGAVAQSVTVKPIGCGFDPHSR